MCYYGACLYPFTLAVAGCVKQWQLLTVLISRGWQFQYSYSQYVLLSYIFMLIKIWKEKHSPEELELVITFL